MKKKLLLGSILLFTALISGSQMLPGEWREHLPYHMTKKVVAAGDRIYVCSNNSLFYYDKDDGSINKLTKLQGLSDVTISTMDYSSEKDILIVAYTSSNIDFIQKNHIQNFPYIKNKISIPDRRINDITIIGSTAYLSCGFGIVVLDLNKLQVKDTYYPGVDQSVNAVNSTSSDGHYLFAATNSGLFMAEIDNRYLADFSNWQLIKDNIGDLKCAKTEVFDNKLFAVFETEESLGIRDTIVYTSDYINWYGLPLDYSKSIRSIQAYNQEMYIVSDFGVYKMDKNLKYQNIYFSYYTTCAINDGEFQWFTDGIIPLIKRSLDGTLQEIEPNSPFFPEVVKMDFSNGVLWTVAGSKAGNWSSMYSNRGAELFYNNTWYNYNYFKNDAFKKLVDIINVKIDPADNEHAFLVTWTYGGLIEYNHGNIKVYDANNSIIKPFIPSYDKTDSIYKLNGLDFDKMGNLWFTASKTAKPLLVKRKDGKWNSFSLGQRGNDNLIGDVLVTSWGHKWVVIGNSTSLIAFDDKGSLDNDADDDYKNFDIAGIESLNSSHDIYCIAEDHKGNIWIGTDAGPVRFDTPQEVFTNGASPRKIKVPVIKGKKEAAFLLETERINSIAIDGADRKWFGTQNSGAYLISDDGMTQIEHFDSENSPLFSNTIFDIKIDNKTGEIFFATDKGLISYRGMATQGNDNFRNVYVYPNPVRENYNGNIIISGMIENAIIKITDISGNLVNETKSLGGQAVWDGKNLLGKRVNTGVYLVFCSNSDGSKTFVTKLLFIH